MPSEEVQSVLTLVRLKIAALQRKANAPGAPPTTNEHARRLAKGLEEIQEALINSRACRLLAEREASAMAREFPHAP